MLLWLDGAAWEMFWGFHIPGDIKAILLTDQVVDIEFTKWAMVVMSPRWGTLPYHAGEGAIFSIQRGSVSLSLREAGSPKTLVFFTSRYGKKSDQGHCRRMEFRHVLADVLKPVLVSSTTSGPLGVDPNMWGVGG